MMWRSASHLRRTTARVAAATILLSSVVVAIPIVSAQRTTAPVKIAYWQAYGDPVSKAAIHRAVALFNQTHPSIHVTEVDFGGDIDQKALTAISGGKPPDVDMLWNGNNLGDWAARGAVQNLDPLLAALHMSMSDYTPASLSVTLYRNHHYALPFELDDFAFFVNVDLFHAAGLPYPRTWSEVAADAAKLTKKDSAGRITQLGLSSAGGEQFVPFLAPAFNGSWYDATTNTVTPDNQGVLAALRWEKALLDRLGVQAYINYATGKFANPMGDAFMDGHTAMAIDGEWLCNGLVNYAKNVHYLILPMPYPDGHPEWQDSTFIGGAVNVIPAGSAHPQEGLRFLQFLESPQVQVPLMRALDQNPSTKGAANALSQGCLGHFINLIYRPRARAFAWPVLPVANQYSTAVGAAEDKVLRGKESPEQAMAQVKKQIQAALSAIH